MTRERAKLIRDAWEKMGERALNEFLAGRSVAARAILPQPFILAPIEACDAAWPELNALDIVVFRFDCRPHAPPDRWVWRVDCEGIPLEDGLIRTRSMMPTAASSQASPP